MANETILTAEGIRELEERLEYMKTVTRKEIAEQIKEARGFGDLSENAEYDEAKNEQSRIEGEIKQLEDRLRNATVIDESMLNTKTVNVGSTVVVQEQGSSEKVTYLIVGSTEANPLEGKISNESPVGEALLGHGKGDVVEVTTPGGQIEYTILSIKR
ncbi:MAG: transcription elongation factor GreA [Christensenellales bacterium]|jgi:transcription elongation factor GreA